MASTRRLNATSEGSQQAAPAISRGRRPLVRRVSMENAVRALGLLIAEREGLDGANSGFDSPSEASEWALDTLADFLAEVAENEG